MAENRRETGARALKPAPHRPRTDQNAALPEKPEPYGLTRKPDETEKKARHSQGADLSDEGERDG